MSKGTVNSQIFRILLFVTFVYFFGTGCHSGRMYYYSYEFEEQCDLSFDEDYGLRLSEKKAFPNFVKGRIHEVEGDFVPAQVQYSQSKIFIRDAFDFCLENPKAGDCGRMKARNSHILSQISNISYTKHDKSKKCTILNRTDPPIVTKPSWPTN